MYVLFEIQDKYIVMFGVILVLALIVAGVIIFIYNKKNRVKPISEDERFEEVNVIEEKKPTELTEEQKKAREELEKVFNQMNADLQKEPEKVVDTFEREQEENAIISYQELIKQVKGMEIKEEKPIEKETSKEDDTKELIKNVISAELISEEPAKEEKKENYLEALENLKPSIKTLDMEERKPYSGKKSKFNTSEIISPIYGRQDPNEVTETFKMDEAYTAISQDEEQKQNSDFLQTLKEFRNNL